MNKSKLCFGLALIAHLLLFSSFFVTLLFKPVIPEADKQEGKFLPAYVYHEKQDPAQLTRPTESLNNPEKILPPKEADIALKKKQETLVPRPKPDQTMARNSSTQVHVPNAYEPSTLNLKSDKPISKPLLKLLSRATSEKLYYPRSAQDFRATGTVIVRFLLFPSGLVSEVTLVHSSGVGVLDQAALDTINAISPVSGVNVYLKEPQTVEAGIIFG